MTFISAVDIKCIYIQWIPLYIVAVIVSGGVRLSHAGFYTSRGFNGVCL